MSWSKYKVEKKQIYSGGTWIDSVPLETRDGEYIATYDTYYECSGEEPPHDYSREYFTFRTTDNCTFKVNPLNADGSKYIYYSLDSGNTWTSLSANTSTPTVTAGSVVLWKGNVYQCKYFKSTGRFEAEGNIMSLMYGDDFIGKTELKRKNGEYNEGFPYLFYNCSGLTSIDNLVLPATRLATDCYHDMFRGCTAITSVPIDFLPATSFLSEDEHWANYCYEGMFYGCSSLTNVPLLPATILSYYCYANMFEGCSSLTTVPSNLLPATVLITGCYSNMFYGCSSLTNAPTLPATALSENCYYFMFAGCSSLTTAPVLSATTLVDTCYIGMFNGCRNLNYIKCLATDISADRCTYQWTNGVSSTGTFVKNSNMSDWTNGVNGIPRGWTIEDAT